MKRPPDASLARAGVRWARSLCGLVGKPEICLAGRESKLHHGCGLGQLPQKHNNPPTCERVWAAELGEGCGGRGAPPAQAANSGIAGGVGGGVALEAGDMRNPVGSYQRFIFTVSFVKTSLCSF